MDYTRPAVDGGGPSEPINIRRMDAARQLGHIEALLGREGYYLVHQLCGECRDARDVFSTDWQRKKGTALCRDMLTRMAEYWGYKSRPIRARKAS